MELNCGSAPGGHCLYRTPLSSEPFEEKKKKTLIVGVVHILCAKMQNSFLGTEEPKETFFLTLILFILCVLHIMHFNLIHFPSLHSCPLPLQLPPTK